MATSQLKPGQLKRWQGAVIQKLTWPLHSVNPGRAVFDKQTWPPHSLARGKYLTNKRGHLTASGRGRV